MTTTPTNSKQRQPVAPLLPRFVSSSEDVEEVNTEAANTAYQIGIDECGRGPLFGRLYVAGCVLPDVDFRHADMKDSKRFSSKPKMKIVAEYVKQHAIAWHIAFVEPDIIDTVNIRQSVLRAMHECARECIKQCSEVDSRLPFLLIDGNDFKPLMIWDDDDEKFAQVPHVTIEKGDNTYTAIAAASILAKVAHDEYIWEMCRQHPELITKYHLDSNVGYGTKAHMDGIREHGLTEWHRKTFCRNCMPL